MKLDNDKINIAYQNWLMAFPDSLHKNDMQRFDNLSLIILEQKDHLTETEIRNAIGAFAQEWIIDTYIDRFNIISDAYRLMIDSGYAKQ